MKTALIGGLCISLPVMRLTSPLASRRIGFRTRQSHRCRPRNGGQRDACPCSNRRRRRRRRDVLLAPTTASPTTRSATLAVQPAPYSDATPQGSEGGNRDQEAHADYDAQRDRDLGQPRRCAKARTMVMEYVKRSAQSSESEAASFYCNFHSSRPARCDLWLERYQERRMRLPLQQGIGDAARQLSLEQAGEPPRGEAAGVRQHQPVPECGGGVGGPACWRTEAPLRCSNRISA